MIILYVLNCTGTCTCTYIHRYGTHRSTERWSQDFVCGWPGFAIACIGQQCAAVRQSNRFVGACGRGLLLAGPSGTAEMAESERTTARPAGHAGSTGGSHLNFPRCGSIRKHSGETKYFRNGYVAFLFIIRDTGFTFRRESGPASSTARRTAGPAGRLGRKHLLCCRRP